MPLKEFYLELSALLNYFQSLALFFARVAVAYGFYKPASMKWADIDATAIWFSKLGIPFAYFFTLLTASFEIIGVVLLSFGLFTRFISVPLIVILSVAIGTVHLNNGFSVASNGFEIPLYYIIFLTIFASIGAGKFSIDHILFGKDK
jgi:putative oxidoreductase